MNKKHSAFHNPVFGKSNYKLLMFMFAIIMIPTLLLILVIFSMNSGVNVIANIFKINPYLSIALVAVTIIIYCMMIILQFNKYFFEPISELTGIIINIQNGNLNVPIESSKDGDIGTLYREFDKMRLRLKSTIESQYEFEKKRKRLIASVTHDLKTPLTSIKGYVEGLEDGIVKDKETYDLYLSTINEKTDLLNHLIDDLSVFTKEELGEFTLNLERLNSGVLLDTYVNYKQLEFRHSEIELILKKPFISTFINVDPYRFNQILDNLVSNAAKYTSSKIVISTSVSDYNLLVHVEDDGIGIPKEKIPHLFDPFYMINKNKDQKEKGGSGLGLAICKQLAENHDGKILVESNFSQSHVLDNNDIDTNKNSKNSFRGSIFTLKLPMDR